MNNIRFGQWAFNMDPQQKQTDLVKERKPQQVILSSTQLITRKVLTAFFKRAVSSMSPVLTPQSMNSLHRKAFSIENTRDPSWSIIQPGILLMRIFQGMLQPIPLYSNIADLHIHTYKYTYIHTYIYLSVFIYITFIYILWSVGFHLLFIKKCSRSCLMWL